MNGEFKHGNKIEEYVENKENVNNFSNILKAWDDKIYGSHKIKKLNSNDYENTEQFASLLKLWDIKKNKSCKFKIKKHNFDKFGLSTKEPKNKLISENYFNQKKNDEKIIKEENKISVIKKQNEENNINVIKKQNEDNKKLTENDKPNLFNAEKVEFKKYEKNYNEKDFWSKIKKYAIKIGAKPIYIALLLYYSIPKVSIIDKAIIIGSLGYLISPLDLIPDIIPIVGYMDDIAVLMLAFYRIRSKINDEVKKKAKTKFKSIFDKFTDEEISKLID